MQPDWYLRSVLTVIAAALVYLSRLLTPLPTVTAQSARTPGESTGPAEMVIVGWRLGPDAALPVHVPGRVNVAGDVKVINDIRVNGRVQTEQVPRTVDRVVLAGWENLGNATTPGTFSSFNSVQKSGMPVTPQ